MSPMWLFGLYRMLKSLISQNLICRNIETSVAEGKTIFRRRSFTLLMMFAVATMFVFAILVIPLITEQRVYVNVGQDTIIDVSAETINVPLISTFSPAPSYPTGVYTVKIQIQDQNPLFLYNVPTGQYTFVLENITRGVPYTIAVTLLKNSASIDTFTIVVTF